jgi:hypothetical protein
VSISFCVSNLPVDVTEDAIRALFEPLAPVTDIRRVVNPETNEFTRKAIVKLKPEDKSKSDLVRTIHQTFNGHAFGEPWLIATLMYAAPASSLPTLTDTQREMVQSVLAALNETDEIPCYQLTTMMRMFGEEFISCLLREAQAIEDAGGLMVQDGSRRRTFGGVYFYLARQYIRGSAWPLVFDLQRVNAGLEAEKNPKKEAASGRPRAPKGPKASKPPRAKPAPEPESIFRPAQPAPVIVPVVPPPPQREPLDEATLQTLRQQLADLRVEHQAAERDLAAAKSGQIRPKEGVFTLMKRLADAQREIDRLLRTYPELSE